METRINAQALLNALSFALEFVREFGCEFSPLTIVTPYGAVACGGSITIESSRDGSIEELPF